jgi:hypothetical protein
MKIFIGNRWLTKVSHPKMTNFRLTISIRKFFHAYIFGPLPTAPSNFQFTVVAVEYVSKWVDVESLTSITAKNIRKFFWRNIACHFGVPMGKPRWTVASNSKQRSSGTIAQVSYQSEDLCCLRRASSS